jgi:hypothetical protein
LENHYVLIDQVGSIKIDIEVSVRGVKPKWRGYKESWIGLTILMLTHIVWKDQDAQEGGELGFSKKITRIKSY